jgi:hypothetical protein
VKSIHFKIHHYLIFLSCSVALSFLDMSLLFFIAENVVTDTGYVFADKPEMDTSPQISKAASNTGDTGRLICRASGAPKLRFTWSREGATIPVNTTEKYYIDSHQVHTDNHACGTEHAKKNVLTMNWNP